MKRLFVELDERDVQKIIVIAREQRRRPQNQLALWIAERLQAEKLKAEQDAVAGRPGWSDKTQPWTPTAAQGDKT